MEILKYPSKELFKPCEEVTVFDSILEANLQAMWDKMKVERGLGLAANQVGLLQRMFTMEARDGEKLFVVNPKVVNFSSTCSYSSEGCLSAPGQFLELYRPIWITISFQNEKGDKLTRAFTNEYSVCVQHEMEHLEGKSFLQNISVPKRLRVSLAKKWGLNMKKGNLK